MKTRNMNYISMSCLLGFLAACQPELDTELGCIDVNSNGNCDSEQCLPQQIEVSYDLRPSYDQPTGCAEGAGCGDIVAPPKLLGARANEAIATLRFEDTNGDGVVNDNNANVELVYLSLPMDSVINDNTGLTITTFYDNRINDARYTSEAHVGELQPGSARGTYTLDGSMQGSISWEGKGVNSSYEAVEANLTDYERVGSLTCSGGGFLVTCGFVTEEFCEAGECIDALALKNTAFSNTASPWFSIESSTNSFDTGGVDIDTYFISNTEVNYGDGSNGLFPDTNPPSAVVIPSNCN